MLKKSRRKVLFFSIIMVSLLVSSANAQVIDQYWVDEIEAHLLQVDVNTSAEIVVYIVQSLRGHGITDGDGNEISDIVQLGVHIFNEVPLPTPNGDVVGIGKTGLDNGVLVLIAMEEREWRIEVGYGLEGDITDVKAKFIGEDILVPKFQEGNYGEGLNNTVAALAEEIPVPNPTPNLPIRGRYFYENLNPPVADELPPWLVTLIFGGVGIAIIIIAIVIAYLVKTGKIKPEKRSTTWRGGGGWGGGRKPSGGARGGGGRSGGGGAKGKW